MPTRLVVLLHRRKSATAGAACSVAPAPASATSVVMRRAARQQVAMVGRLIMPAARNLRDGSRSVNEDRAEVIDVGAGRAGRQEIAERREKAGGIVVGKKRGRIEAAAPGPRQRGL